jgi:hypothetical protein
MINPYPQYDDRVGATSRDFAGAGKFSLYALERMLRDCAEQPEWRTRAAICGAYYDGKQLTESQKYALRAENLEERVINLVRPVINSVLGQEAKSRTDVKVEADNDDYADVAEVVSAKLKEAERETRAHMAVSDCYASMVKKGLGWVHVSRNSDPLAYPYRVESVPIEEVWWDWRGQRGMTLLDGCRWLVRKRFIDLDELEAGMPEHREVLHRSVNGWENWLDSGNALLAEPDSVSMRGAFENERRFNVTISKQDWVDSARKMIKLYEVWYRVPATCVVLHMGPGKIVAYDENDPRHIEAVSRGLVKVTKGITSQIRRALYAGPHRLLDEGTTKKNFPYIPMFAFRDDEDKSPYGLIDGMVAPQDEYNERRARIQWMLKSRQVALDSDALDTNYNSIADIADGIMRPDLVVITNPNRQNKGQAVQVKNELSMQREQFEVMADSKQLIQDTAGRYASQMGSATAQSGIANSLLIQQGEQSMGEMNDNYTYARRSVFESLVDEITSDYRDERMQVPIGTGKTRRVVVLNDWAPDGMPVNQVKDADIKTSLAETPSTPAYRQQTQQQIAQIIQALGTNPQAVAILAPAYMESTSYHNRQEVADSLRKASGLPMPGDKNGQAEADAMQQQQLQQKMQQEAAAAQAITDDKVASAERNRASARQANASAALIEQRLQSGVAADDDQAKTAKTMSEVELNEARIKQMAQQEQDQMINDAMAEALT